MKIKTCELKDAALDWAVAKCVNPAYGRVRTHQDNKDQWHVTLHGERGSYAPRTDWAQGGPIIEREITKIFRNVGGTWSAMILKYVPIPPEDRGTSFALTQRMQWNAAGATPLIAAMRCYVASKLGDEVDVPEELT